jgi:hypothetical protein
MSRQISRRDSRIGVVLAVLGLVLSVGLAAQASAPRWTIQPTPNPTGAKSSQLSGVACLSSSVCTAVGDYTNGAGTDVTLAEHRNGTRWIVQPTPTPTGAKGGSFVFLSAVACPTVTDCTAVGHYNTPTESEVPVVEQWNGSNWTIQPTPTPTGVDAAAGIDLAGVTCRSVTDCTAVGDYFNKASTPVTLVEHWNGSHWTIQPTPNPPGPSSSFLDGVACPTLTDCIAVGDYYNQTGNWFQLAEHWNGSHWTIQPLPSPSGAKSSYLTGVACPSATACFAVGFDNGAPPGSGLVQAWNGSHWTIQPTPTPTGATSSDLLSVTCPSPTECTAVGDAIAHGTAGSLVEHWNGSTWRIQATPKPTTTILYAVSCPSTNACTAVGSTRPRSGNSVTLAETWQG